MADSTGFNTMVMVGHSLGLGCSGLMSGSVQVAFPPPLH